MAESGDPEAIDEDVLPEPGLGGVFETVRPGRGPTYKTRRHPPMSHMDQTRRWLAIGIVGVAVLTAAGVIIAHVFGWMDTATFSSTMSGLSGLQALAAAVVGFYYGASKSD